MNSKKKKDNRGGTRKGAGRPINPNKIIKYKYTIKIHDKDLMQTLTDKLPRQRDAYIEKAIVEKASKDGLYKKE